MPVSASSKLLTTWKKGDREAGKSNNLPKKYTKNIPKNKTRIIILPTWTVLCFLKDKSKFLETKNKTEII